MGGVTMCANQKSLRHTQSEQGAEKMFGLRVINREQKRKNKEQKKNKEPKTCLDVWLRVIKGYV